MSASVQSKSAKLPVMPDMALTETEEMWLMIRHPFLTAVGFNAAVDLELGYRGKEQIQTTEQRWNTFVEVRAMVIAIAFSQMEAIANVASEHSPEGVVARKVLCMILISALEQQDEIRDFCLPLAAKTLRSLMWQEYVESNPDSVINCITYCLTNRLELSEGVRIDLLAAFQTILVCSAATSSAWSCDQIAAILNDTLMLELVRPSTVQSVEFCKQLLGLIVDNPQASTRSVLRATAAFHDLPAVRELATSALESLNTLRHRWESCPVDQVATNEERALSMNDAMESTTDASLIEQNIFNNMKGMPLSETGDDRIYPLRELLLAQDKHVRVAACWAIISGNHYSRKLDEFLNCTDVIAQLAINSGSLSVSYDAITMIDKLNNQFPALSQRMAQASERATQAFLKHYGRPEFDPRFYETKQ